MTCRSVIILVVIIIILTAVALALFLFNTRRKEGFTPIDKNSKKSSRNIVSAQQAEVSPTTVPKTSFVTKNASNTVATGVSAASQDGKKPSSAQSVTSATPRKVQTTMAAPGPIFAERIVMKVDDIASLFDTDTDYVSSLGVSKEEFTNMVADYKQKQKIEPARVPKTLHFDISKYNAAQNNLMSSVVNHADKRDPIKTSDIMQTYLAQ